MRYFSLARGLGWMMSGVLGIGTIGVGTIGISAPAIAQVSSLSLYNPARRQLPSTQGWFSSIPSGATQQLLTTTGATDLNTSSSVSLQSGYMRFSPLNLTQLNRNTGYTIRLDLQLLAETHNSPHRAGFSLINVSSDNTRAIELSFWSDRIWTQNDASNGALFTQGEGVARVTGGAVQRYDLVVQGDNYCLFAANQLSQPILKGKLRNYSSFGFPYSYRNLLWIGDNTQSASAISRIERVEYSSAPIAPCR